MDVKSSFLYGTIKKEVYVHQPLGFDDPAHPNKVYKVIKALYGLHQAPRAWYEILSSFLMENGFKRGTIDKTLFIKKKKSDIMLGQVYVDDIIFGSTKKFMCTEFEDSDILKKFDFWSIGTATTPIESNKPLVKDEDGVDIDVHVYRSMIGSLMYLTASRPDIRFAVCACARFQVTPKASHLNAVKRIFRYLKHQPKLGLWYPKDSPFELEAYLDSDYRGASLDKKSTTGGCQFLGRRLISWQCKKQTIVANSTTEAEYVAAANCCGQVLWIQNQMMDYGFNFMNTKIHIDNESTISVIKNPVAHSRTKHIEIRFHFIRDCYEKRLIEVIKIHTDHNVADLLTKGFDVTRFNFLVVSIGLLNLESLERDIDGTEELLLPDLFILWLTKVSTDSAKLVPLGKDSTAIKPLEKIPPRGIVPLLPAMLAGAAVDQGEGSAPPAEPHPTPVDPIPSTSHSPLPSPQHQSPPHLPLHHSPYQSPPHSPHHSPRQSSPYFSPPRSYEAPIPEGNTLGSAEDSVQLKELMILVPKLVTRINSFEKELKDTKHILGNVVLKLVKKVKTLETALKRKSKKVLISESEGEAHEEEISPTILEAAKTLSKIASQGVSKEKSTDKGKRYRRRARSIAKKIDIGLDAEEEINTGREEINTGIKEVSTGSTKVDSATASERGQREGKAPMVEEDI
ncbi:putative ribonuclease H-like domain-containing protein [Tanacetum coccineum]